MFFFISKSIKHIRYKQIYLYVHGPNLIPINSSNVLIYFYFINSHLAIKLQTNKMDAFNNILMRTTTILYFHCHNLMRNLLNVLFLFRFHYRKRSISCTGWIKMIYNLSFISIDLKNTNVYFSINRHYIKVTIAEQAYITHINKRGSVIQNVHMLAKGVDITFVSTNFGTVPTMWYCFYGGGGYSHSGIISKSNKNILETKSTLIYLTNKYITAQFAGWAQLLQ